MAAISAEQAISLVEKVLTEVQPAVESAIHFHQVRRTGQEDTFAAAKARRAPEEHARRAETCKNNKQVIDALSARIKAIAQKHLSGE